MIIFVAFLLTISAVNSLPVNSRDCFEHSEMQCMENFVDAVFYKNKGVDECSELRKFADCSADAVDECFGDDRDPEVDKGLEELENLCKDTCGAVSSGDNSDFDEETYSHIHLTATIKKKKKKASDSTTSRKTSISSDSNNCFSERKKICWDTFEDAVIHSIFFSSRGLDKCSVLQHFLLCTAKAANDCFENEHEEKVDQVLSTWENKYKEFCEGDDANKELTPSRREYIHDDEGAFVRMTASPVVLDSDECLEGKAIDCISKFEAAYDASMIYRDRCRKLEKLLADCLRYAVSQCMREDPSAKVIKVNNEIEEFLERFCKEEKYLSDLFHHIAPLGYMDFENREGEKCILENADNIRDFCIEKASEEKGIDENMTLCLRWNVLVRCTLNEIDKKCGEASSKRFEIQIPLPPKEVKMACDISGNPLEHSSSRDGFISAFTDTNEMDTYEHEYEDVYYDWREPSIYRIPVSSNSSEPDFFIED